VRGSLEVSPIRGITLHVGLTQFRRPWRTALTPFPAAGRELELEATLRPASGFQVIVLGEERWLEHKVSGLLNRRTEMAILAEPRRRIQCTMNLSRGSTLHLRGRFEVVRFLNAGSGSDESGWMVFGDVRWEPVPWLGVSTRMSLFQTDSYDAGIYSTESDVGGVSGSTLLNGTGRRWYCLVACHPFPSLRLSVRYLSSVHVRGTRLVSEESRLSLQADFRVDPLEWD
jgi:hypothetical protein